MSSPSKKTKGSTKNNRKKQQQKRKVNKNVVTPARKQALTLKPCSLNFLHARADPFGFALSGTEVCIPDDQNIPTFKFSQFYRGTFTIGLSGFGFIAVAPYTRSTGPIAIYSLPTYDLADITAVGAGTINATKWPLLAETKSRVVAIGLRARYSGTELNRSGTIVPIACLNSLDDAMSGMDLSRALNRPSVKSFPCTRAWRGTTFNPGDPYSVTFEQTGANAGNSANCKLAILVTGVPGMTYDFEIRSYHEGIPGSQDSILGSTPSHSDASGYSLAKEYLGAISSSEVGQHVWDQGLTFMKKAAMSYLTPVGTPLLGWTDL